MNRPFFEAVPVEMHGHRKKLEFFLAALERFRAERNLRASEVTILEVGCSHGRNVALPVAEHGYVVTGLDVHEPSIEAAKQASDMINATFVATELSNFQCDRPYHVLILSDVLEHVDDPAGMIARALTYLCPDGIVLISIPNGYGPFEIERWLVDKGLLKPILVIRDGARWMKHRLVRTGRALRSSLPAYNWDSGHVQFFTRRSFSALLEVAGLRIVQQANGCLFGGEFTSYLHQYVPGLTPRSLWLANRLPASVVSTWYFECRPASNGAGRSQS